MPKSKGVTTKKKSSQKKKSPAKKPSKKKAVKKPDKKKEETKAIVIQQEAVQPILHEHRFSLAPTWVEEKQLSFLLQRTPREHVYSRPGKGGGEWYYVTGVWVKKVLNYVFGFNWDFDVLDEKVYGVAGKEQVVVKGRLTVRDSSGKQSVTKMQYGRAEVKYRRGGKGDYLDIGNDFKAAATDALKKCASELGVASDIYGASEFKDIGKDVPVQSGGNTEDVGGVDPEVVGGVEVGKPFAECHGCGEPMNEQQVKYSQRMNGGKTMCGKC